MVFGSKYWFSLGKTKKTKKQKTKKQLFQGLLEESRPPPPRVPGNVVFFGFVLFFLRKSLVFGTKYWFSLGNQWFLVPNIGFHWLSDLLLDEGGISLLISYWFLIRSLREESWSSPDHLLPHWIIKRELELPRPFPY